MTKITLRLRTVLNSYFGQNSQMIVSEKPMFIKNNKYNELTSEEIKKIRKGIMSNSINYKIVSHQEHINCEFDKNLRVFE